MKRTHTVLGVVLAFLAIAFFCVGVSAQPEPDPAQSADQIFNTPAGNFIRVSGAQVPPGAPVLPSPIGDAVSVPSLAGATCNVMLDGIPVEVRDPDTDRLIRLVPDIPELAHTFNKVHPVMISMSEGTQGNFYWNTLLTEGDCATAADSISYVVSSMQELFPLVGQPPWKCRLLRSVIQVDVDGVVENRTVTSCDPRVVPAFATITIPHSWAGRWGDLNFRGFANGVMGDRVRPGGK